jgi:transcriptional regulator with XRE-family HTH domain
LETGERRANAAGEEANKTQGEFARDAGLNHIRISCIENPERNPPHQTLEKLAVALGGCTAAHRSGSIDGKVTR